ncbi:putative membrane protein involved in D-alanine export [Bernardetia litoralis DSM 6794]|uniref:Putative membrane protein involved in D-alanine export n=1 Tax=Bernardetia litoralis (strain ATCC 23117 / DSM 6794 / NBRC 15988 / NCIMB 1366 / Fx l1 / Sio-4) TaxID=880071 RepID=I4AIV8_BERLS|nr:MBOAT family O-acyltransferase [Bernardetia litoralis]AFM03893.1 putative membrane protein involved in D-alanine export [Bernardetia litoralis DSM 6794]
MLFNSIDFAIFLPIVFVVYWFITNKNLKLQNFLIVASSYFFYGWWDWRFLFLIFLSSLVDYLVGRGFSKIENQTKRKLLLATSIIFNLGLLIFFKYYNFFIDNFVTAFTFLGNPIKINTLDIILPVGISFYTFQTLSYSIDVYRRKLKPTNDFIAFLAFVSFFPQLVAGPIERATHLLPQFYTKRIFDYNNAVLGVRQILWGLFKKIVIADNCAEYANLIFNNSTDYVGLALVLGALFFTFQIYGDFSGYSDIAIGTSRLLGFDLMRNFNFPYFSRDIAEFWRRWHISLSTWFRDYLYIPLGGSRGSIWLKIRNTFIIFIVSGFWHGANWTFIVWGALNAIYFLPLLLTKNNRANLDIVAKGKYLPTIKEFFAMLMTFALTVFAWIFFRAETITHALQYIRDIFKYFSSFWSLHIYWNYRIPIILILLFLIIEWIGREDEFAISNFGLKWKRVFRWIFYLLICLSILLLGSVDKTEFIYFAF